MFSIREVEKRESWVLADSLSGSSSLCGRPVMWTLFWSSFSNDQQWNVCQWNVCFLGLFFIHSSLNTYCVLDLRLGCWGHRNETDNPRHMKFIFYWGKCIWNKQKTGGHNNRKWLKKGGSGTLRWRTQRRPLSRDVNQVKAKPCRDLKWAHSRKKEQHMQQLWGRNHLRELKE